jgi:PKHD-type hydroxylase|tara:strand:+ start:1541 stop:2170 length:630 start_codon:yes stop_codon:yes gene_type:complete
MNLNNYYWYFQSALTPRFCDEVIKYGNLLREEVALTGKQEKKGKNLSNEDIKDLKKKRDSNISWFSDEWVYKEVSPYVSMANINAGWNFKWNWSETCQFTKYKLNQFYDWHCDSWEKPYGKEHDNPNYTGKVRKLSVTCSLSDPNNYSGGELEFQFRNRDDPNTTVVCKEIMPRGSIVVFPSFVWHRVRPVTKGVRYSLVVWNLGYPFK